MIKNIKQFVKDFADQITDYYEKQYEIDSQNYQSKEIKDLLKDEYKRDLDCIYSSLSMIQSLMEDRQ